MDVNLKALIAAILACAFGLVLPVNAANAADGEVQRQLRLREQQQMELRLRMQQQLDRAVRPPVSGGAGLALRGLETGQLRKLEQMHERELRLMPLPGAAGAHEALREFERRRALQAGSDQLQRFGLERRMQVSPGTIPSGTEGP